MASSDDSGSASEYVEHAASPRRSLAVRAAAVAGLLTTGLLAAWLLSPPPRRGTRGASTVPVASLGGAIGLQEAADTSWTETPVVAQNAQGGPTGEATPTPPPISQTLDTYFKMMMGVPASSSIEDDANACYENEEIHQGLCYKKCKLLTNGTFPLRTSAWTCCSAAEISDCFVTNQDKDFGLCSGYDVAGDGDSCPRQPGKCMSNEEKFLGQCYEKCSILTNGTKPYRTSGISCCATKLALSCFQPSNVVVTTDMQTGGGAGDGDTSTPATVHAPGQTGSSAATLPVIN